MRKPAIGAIAMIGLMLVATPALAAERWTGVSTAQDAGSGRCRPLTFDLSIDGATIAGTASSLASGGQHMEWRVTGQRSGATITFDTLHRENTPNGRLQQIRWIGRVSGDQMQITQNEQSVSCAAPRSAVLRRS